MTMFTQRSSGRRGDRPRLLLTDLKRSWVRLVGAGVGVTLGAAVMTFLFGLGQGIEDAVVTKLMPSDRIEVAADRSQINLGPLRMELGSDVLDNDDCDRLREIDGVDKVWPKVGLAVPAMASGGAVFLGQDLVTELAIEGIDSSLLVDEIDGTLQFAARPLPDQGSLPCRADRDCQKGEFCVDTPEKRGVCRPAMPVVVSGKLIDLYNGSIRKAYGLPQINPDAVIGLAADVQFGASSFSASARRGVLRDRVVLVGFSDRAIPIGVTAPLEEVERLNAHFGDRHRRGGYDSVVLGLASGLHAGAVTSAVRRAGYRVVQDDIEKVAAAVSIGVWVLRLTGLSVVAVALLGVVHTFSSMVEGRRREIAILRSVGASGSDVVSLFLGEAALVGVAGGGTGAIAGVMFGKAADFAFLRALPQLPFLPESLFKFGPDVLVSVVLVAVVGALAGAALPVLRAVRNRTIEML